MRTERAHHITRHLYGAEVWMWHKDEDGPCRLCDVQALIDAAKPIGKTLGHYIRPDDRQSEGALERLDAALLNVLSPRGDAETVVTRSDVVVV